MPNRYRKAVRLLFTQAGQAVGTEEVPEQSGCSEGFYMEEKTGKRWLVYERNRWKQGISIGDERDRTVGNLD